MSQDRQAHASQQELVLVVPSMSFYCCLDKQILTKAHSAYFWPPGCNYVRSSPNPIAVSIKSTLRT